MPAPMARAAAGVAGSSCAGKVKAARTVAPFAPGGANLAAPAAVVMQLATDGLTPVLLDTLTESISPAGGTLIGMTSRPGRAALEPGTFPSPLLRARVARSGT